MIKRMLVLALILLVAIGGVFATAAQDDGLGTITIGTNAEYPPFESVDDADQIVGFDVDLMAAIAEDAGFEFEWVNTRWDGIFVALSEGEFDAVISAATITEEREDIVDFSDPYFNAGQAIAVTTDLADTVSTIEDLVGLRVGVQLGTTGDEYASEIDGIEVVRFDEITLAFQAMGEGSVDAIINDGPVSADIIANNPDLEAVIVGDPLTDEFYGVAVYPERADLLDAINISLANIIADGTYAEIYKFWFGQEAPSAFQPEEEMVFEVDPTDPVSVFVGFIDTMMGAEDVSELDDFYCAEPAESPLVLTELPDYGELALADASGLEFETEEMEDGSIMLIPSGSVVLSVGDAEQEVAVDMFLGQMAPDGIPMVEEDGAWVICPTAMDE